MGSNRPFVARLPRMTGQCALRLPGRLHKRAGVSLMASCVVWSCAALVLVSSALAQNGGHSPSASAPAANQTPAVVLDGASRNDTSTLKEMEDQIASRDFKGSIPALRQYVKKNPDSARAHYDLGYALFRTHQLGDSIRQLSKSLELNPRDAQAHKILGLDCSLVGRYDLAEVELQQAARFEPNSAEIHYLLGRIYYTREVYPLAGKEFEAAIRLNPAYTKAFANLGLVREIQGKNGDAVKDYQTAIRLNRQQKSGWAWPYEYLSAYYNRQQRYQEAIAFARKAISTDPKLDLAYFQIARANENLGRWKKCEAAARKAIALNSRTPDYYYVLSHALRKQGKAEASEAALKTFEKLHQKQLTESERWQKAQEHSLQTASSRSGQP
ncbi:MAG TPA: tetratricopeptide repeat protein [Terriglobia bacterium]|nr:tetratricopeptide repeat protein [Terriglobia bacterium]